MKIGIIVAMSVELDCVKGILSDLREENIDGSLFYIGHIGNKEIVLTQSGIGKVCAAIRTVEMIMHYRPDYILNTGVAGGIDPAMQVMDVVIGGNIVYHDVWCGEGNEYGQIQGLPARFHSDPQLVEKAIGIKSDVRIYSGLICSGDKFITAREELNRIKADFPEGMAVDMESGAIAQVCHMKGIPFISFRIISDTPGVDEHFAQYTNFWHDAPQKTYNILKQLLEVL